LTEVNEGHYFFGKRARPASFGFIRITFFYSNLFLPSTGLKNLRHNIPNKKTGAIQFPIKR
jgi:hypothetical protein